MSTKVRVGMLLLVASAWMGAPQTASADTIGSSLVARGMRDYNWGGLFVYDAPFADAGASVVEWAFYGGPVANGQSATGAGNLITPLLFVETDPVSHVFEILGIGTTRENQATGEQRFAFGLVSGSNIVQGSHTYFGWRDGNIDGSTINDGSIELSGTGGPGLYYYPSPAPQRFDGEIAPGLAFAFVDSSTATRTYSVQATAVPEPSTMLLLGAGLVGMLRARKRVF